MLRIIFMCTIRNIVCMTSVVERQCRVCIIKSCGTYQSLSRHSSTAPPAVLLSICHRSINQGKVHRIARWNDSGAAGLLSSTRHVTFLFMPLPVYPCPTCAFTCPGLARHVSDVGLYTTPDSLLFGADLSHMQHILRQPHSVKMKFER